MNGPHVQTRPAPNPALTRIAWGFGLAAAILLVALWPLDEPWKTRAARRLARGIALKPIDYVQLWFWWGIAANALLCGLLAATARWWTPWTALPPTPPGETSQPAKPRTWTLTLLGILLLAALVRFPFLDDPMRRDESDTAVRNVHGVTLVTGNGSRTFQPADWIHALWEDAGANNPVLFSLLSHAGLDLWRGLYGEPRDRFAPAVLRWPSFAAGIAACAALAELGRRAGSPSAGRVAAVLLAIHPWHIRYSTEGRGYALNVLGVLAACLCLVEAMRSGQWRWWTGWAVSVFAALYAYPAAIYLPAVATFAAAIWIGTGLPTAWRRPQLIRLMLSTTLAGGLFILLMLPCVPQILAYLHQTTARGPMGATWWAEWIGCLSTGIQLGIYDGRPPSGFGRVFELRDALRDPWVTGLSAVLIPLFWAAGALRLARSSAVGRWLTAVALASPLLTWIHNRLSGNYLYPWYLFYFLPFTLLFIAAALEGLAARVPVPGFPRILVPLLFLGTFVFASTEPRHRLHRETDEPFVSFIRGKYEDRVYPQGWITRHIRPEWRAESQIPTGDRSEKPHS